MSKEEREFLDALRKRSIEASAEILEGVQRLKSMYEEMTADSSGEPMPKPRLGDHFYQLAKFELEHASTLIRLGNSQAEMVFDHLRHLARRTQKTTTAVLELAADPQNPAQSSARFEVKNPFDKPGDLRFEIAALKDASGNETPTKLRVEPKKKGPLRPHDTVYLEVSAPAVTDTLFGDLKVFLLADIEKQIAHRVIKVQAMPADAPVSAAAEPRRAEPKK